MVNSARLLFAGSSDISKYLTSTDVQLGVLLKRFVSPFSELRRRASGQFLECLVPRPLLVSVSKFVLVRDLLQSQSRPNLYPLIG